MHTQYTIRYHLSTSLEYVGLHSCNNRKSSFSEKEYHLYNNVCIKLDSGSLKCGKDVYLSPISTVHHRFIRLRSLINLWVHVSCYSDATGKFPDFPDTDDGGSEAIFKKREEVS